VDLTDFLARFVRSNRGPRFGNSSSIRIREPRCFILTGIHGNLGLGLFAYRAIA
jgi:hypothetical protein